MYLYICVFYRIKKKKQNSNTITIIRNVTYSRRALKKIYSYLWVSKTKKNVGLTETDFFVCVHSSFDIEITSYRRVLSPCRPKP